MRQSGTYNKAYKVRTRIWLPYAFLDVLQSPFPSRGLQLQLAEASRVSNYIDSNDLPTRNREIKRCPRLSTRGPDEPDDPTYEGWLGTLSSSHEGLGHGRGSTYLAGEWRCASGSVRYGTLHGCGVSSEDDIRIENCKKAFEVAAA